MFGGANKPPPIGTSFGGAGTQQQQPPPAPGGFGSTTFGTGNTSAPTAGNTAAPSFGFGSVSATTTKPPPLFGTSTATSGLFGAQSATTAAPKPLFGAPTTTSTASTSQPGGLFGAPAVATSAPSMTGFGATTTGSSLFNQPKQPTTSLFGAAPATNASGGGLFAQPAATTTTGFAGFQQASFGAQQQPQQPPSQQSQVTDLIQQMAAFWNPSHPQCQFKHYFYNMVHPSEVHLYKPGPGEDPTLYEQAQRDNPDPSCMVPVLASGFEDIRKRIASQDQQCQIHKQKLEEIVTQLDSIQNRHFVDTIVKLEQYKRRERQIAQKVFQLMKTVQLLRNRGYTIRAEEEVLKSRLEMMERELQKPSVFRGRLSEIWAQLQQLNESRRFVQSATSTGASASGTEDGVYGVSHEESLRPIYQTLAGLQEGLLHLTDVVNQDKKAVDTILRAYAEAGHR